MKKYYFTFVAVLLMPIATLAFELPSGSNPWTAIRIADFLDKAANFLIWAGVVGAIITIVYAGIVFFTHGFNPKAVENAKGILKNAIIGVAIVVGFGVIINTVAAVITGNFFGITDQNQNQNGSTLASCLSSQRESTCCEGQFACDSGCNAYWSNSQNNSRIRPCGSQTSSGGLGEPCSGGKNCSQAAGLKCNSYSDDTICVRKNGGNEPGEPCLGGNDCLSIASCDMSKEFQQVVGGHTTGTCLPN